MLFAVFGVLCFDGGYGGWVCWFIAVWVCYCVVCELMFADLQVLLVILVCLFVVLWWLVCFVVVVCLL